MNVVIVTDQNLVKYIPSFIKSMYEFNKNERINLYILMRKVEDSKKDILLKHCESYDSINVTIKNVCHEVYESKWRKLSVTTDEKFFIPDLLSDIDKVIYMDIDIVVRCSLKELWGNETSEKGIAGTKRLFQPEARSMMSKIKKAGVVKLRDDYFINAGVLLFDLDKLRKYNFRSYCHELHLKHNIDDQPCINAYDLNIRVLDGRFNVNRTYFDDHEETIKQNNYKGYVFHIKWWHERIIQTSWPRIDTAVIKENTVLLGDVL